MTRRIHTLIDLVWDPVSRQYQAVSKASYPYNGPVAHAGGSPVLEHTDWAFYDDGTESGSVIIGAKNIDPSLEVDTIYLYRAGVEETAGTKWNNGKIQLQYNHNGGGLNDVNATSSVVQSVATGNIADGDDTTQRLTAFTYITANGCFDEVDGSAGGGQYDPRNSGAEGLFAFQIIGADVSASDTIVLKVVNGVTSSDFDVYNQTDPTITVSADAAYSIDGAVTVNTTIAAAMAHNQHPAIIGALAIDLTIAADMAYAVGGVEHLITGDVTVNSTIAATTAYNQNPAITGDVTVNTTIAATTAYNLNAAITGDVTVNSTIASAMVYNFSAAITGDVTVNSTIASAMAYQSGSGDYQIIGAVTIDSTIAGVMAYNQHPEYTGDVTVNSTIASGMVYEVGGVGYQITGDVTVNSTIGAATAYNQNPAITGAVTINNTITGVMEFTLNAAIAGDVTVDLSILAAMSYTSYLQPGAQALPGHVLAVEYEDLLLVIEREDHTLTIET